MKKDESRFQQSPDVLYTALDDDEAALMHLGTELPYALNKTGILIWGLLQDGCSEDEIVQVLATGFDVEPGQAREDAAGFIRELLSFDLIEEMTNEGQG